MKLVDWAKLVLAVAICEATGALGATATVSAIPSWYATLAKPPLNPPSWIFGPVWTTLYLLMGIAAFLVWRAGWDRRDVKHALDVFVLQLALNGIWSPIFFGAHNPGLAFAVIIAMWLAILWTARLFRRISPASFWLLMPYLAWVTFASYLNLGIWILN